MTLSLRPDRYSNDAAVRNFWDEVLQRVREVPGVESAAVATNAPMTGNHDRFDITIEGMAIKLKAQTSVSIEGATIEAKGQAQASVQAAIVDVKGSGAVNVSASGALALKGATVAIN